MKSLLAKWSTFPIIKPPIKVAPFVASEYTTEKINTVITFAIISEAGDTGTVLIWLNHNRNPAISRLCEPEKIKKTYHITQNAVRGDTRAAFLCGGRGQRG